MNYKFTISNMKKIASILLVYIFFVLLCACNKNSTELPNEICEEEDFFKSDPLLYITYCKSGLYGRFFYENRIGCDFETALDSVIVFSIKQRSEIHLPHTQIDTIQTNYELDNRLFILITFYNKNIHKFPIFWRIIDSKGNVFFTFN